jgi:rieske iron-sulfur protein
LTNIDRRALLLAGLGLAFKQTDPSASRPKAGDLLVKAGDAARRPLTASDIQLGAPQTLAWPMDRADRVVRSGSRLNQVVLLRLDAQTLADETRARAADGVVAYSAICTHTGCGWHVSVIFRSSTRETAPKSWTGPRRGRCRRCR